MVSTNQQKKNSPSWFRTFSRTSTTLNICLLGFRVRSYFSAQQSSLSTGVRIQSLCLSKQSGSCSASQSLQRLRIGSSTKECNSSTVMVTKNLKIFGPTLLSHGRLERSVSRLLIGFLRYNTSRCFSCFHFSWTLSKKVCQRSKSKSSGLYARPVPTSSFRYQYGQALCCFTDIQKKE